MTIFHQISPETGICDLCSMHIITLEMQHSTGTNWSCSGKKGFLTPHEVKIHEGTLKHSNARTDLLNTRYGSHIKHIVQWPNGWINKRNTR